MKPTTPLMELLPLSSPENRTPIKYFSESPMDKSVISTCKLKKYPTSKHTNSPSETFYSSMNTISSPPLKTGLSKSGESTIKMTKNSPDKGPSSKGIQANCIVYANLDPTSLLEVPMVPSSYGILKASLLMKSSNTKKKFTQSLKSDLNYF